VETLSELRLGMALCNEILLFSEQTNSLPSLEDFENGNLLLLLHETISKVLVVLIYHCLLEDCLETLSHGDLVRCSFNLLTEKCHRDSLHSRVEPLFKESSLAIVFLDGLDLLGHLVLVLLQMGEFSPSIDNSSHSLNLLVKNDVLLHGLNEFHAKAIPLPVLERLLFALFHEFE